MKYDLQGQNLKADVPNSIAQVFFTKYAGCNPILPLELKLVKSRMFFLSRLKVTLGGGGAI